MTEPFLCPVDGCTHSTTDKNTFSVRKHFASRHPGQKIHITTESQHPYPSCPNCSMQIKPSTMATHPETQWCQQLARSRRGLATQMKIIDAKARTITIDNHTLETVAEYRHLGQPKTTTLSDDRAVSYNITKARQRWAQMRRILVRDTADPIIMARFYTAAVVSVLLYACETWTLTDRIVDRLTWFHNQAARRMSGLQKYYDPARDEWITPPASRALRKCNMDPLPAILANRTQYIATFAQESLLRKEVDRLIIMLGKDPKNYWTGNDDKLRTWNT